VHNKNRLKRRLSDRVGQYFVEIFGFLISGLILKKFEIIDLHLAHLRNPLIGDCGFAICGLKKSLLAHLWPHPINVVP
jgi:hypothetical protein